MFNMTTRNHKIAFTCGSVGKISKLEEGYSLMSVAQEFGIDKSIVSRSWKVFHMTSSAVRNVDAGWLRENNDK